MGRTTSGQVDPSADDPRAAEVRSLVARIDFAALAGGAARPAYPDMFTYVFPLDDQTVTLPETQLTDELRRLAALVLEESDPLS